MIRTGVLVVALLIVAASIVGHHVGVHDVAAVDHVAGMAAGHDDTADDGEPLHAATATCLGLLVALWVLSTSSRLRAGRTAVTASRHSRCVARTRRSRPATPVVLGVLLRV